MAIKAGQTAVYALRCPTSGEVRYVGQTADPGRRLRHHLVQEAHGDRGQLAKSQWIVGLLAKGLKPSLEVLEWVDAEDAIEAERRWIAKFDGLTNYLHRTPEHVQRVADSLRGRTAVATQGSKNPAAKLTDAQVLEIRRLWDEGTRGRQLAELYGITYANAWFIGTRRTWAHLEEAGS